MMKKTLANNITRDDIDRYYEAALAAGALGGKVTGAGGGGFLLFYCPVYKRTAFLETMWSMGLMELPFKFEEHGSRVIFSQNDSQ